MWALFGDPQKPLAVVSLTLSVRLYRWLPTGQRGGNKLKGWLGKCNQAFVNSIFVDSLFPFVRKRQKWLHRSISHRLSVCVCVCMRMREHVLRSVVCVYVRHGVLTPIIIILIDCDMPRCHRYIHRAHRTGISRHIDPVETSTDRRLWRCVLHTTLIARRRLDPVGGR